MSYFKLVIRQFSLMAGSTSLVVKSMYCYFKHCCSVPKHGIIISCRSRTGRLRARWWAGIRWGYRGIWGGDLRTWGSLGGCWYWPCWPGTCPRQSSVHNPYFQMITEYIYDVHLRYRHFMETTCINISTMSPTSTGRVAAIKLSYISISPSYMVYLG